MHSDFLGKLRQLMTLLLGDRRLQGLGYPGVPEDQVMEEMVVIDTVMNTALLVQVLIMVRYCRCLILILILQVLAKILRLTGTSVTKEDSLCSPHCKVCSPHLKVTIFVMNLVSF